MGSVYSLSGTASLGESWSNDAPPSHSSSAGGSSNASSAPPPDVNPKDISTIPALSKVEQLKGTNPTEFQQVVTDAVTELKVAARQTSDPFAASFLWNLANRFQLALDSGDGLPPQDTSANAASGPEAA
jgi:hypothetical protein